MIKIENTEVFGWEAAIRGMRNAKNSWHLSDSVATRCDGVLHSVDIGENDMKLMKTLAKAGDDHGKFLRMINVTVDITAPLYFLKEWDTYKVGTVANSCSTMHKIHAKEFTLDDFSHEHLTHYAKYGELCRDWLGDLEDLIDDINFAREKFLETKDKKYWWQMIQLLPTSYNQKRTVMLSYEVLHNIYFSRKDRKLDEWHTLCEYIETHPYSEIITTPMKNINIEIEDAIEILQDAGYLVTKNN